MPAQRSGENKKRFVALVPQRARGVSWYVLWRARLLRRNCKTVLVLGIYLLAAAYGIRRCIYPNLIHRPCRPSLPDGENFVSRQLPSEHQKYRCVAPAMSLLRDLKFPGSESKAA